MYISISKPFSFMYTVSQLLFVSGAIWSIVISSSFAFLMVLLFTKNIRVALFSLMTIALIVVGVIGCNVLLGGTLGSARSVCITILVGFSVDYTVHLAVAYVHSKKSTTPERVIDALSAMGVSVTAAAVSTFTSSLFLFAATLAFFLQFGIFMALAVAWAYLCGTFVFMSLLCGFGPLPETNYSDLKRCFGNTKKQMDTGDKGLNNGMDVATSNDISLETNKTQKVSKKIEVRLTSCLCVGLVLALFIMISVFYSIESGKRVEDEDIELKTDESYYIPESITSLKVNEWTEIRPKGNTKCARGTPFAFFVKRGKSLDKVIVEFMGGGACWSKETCGLQTAIFSETAESARQMFRDLPPSVAVDGKENKTGESEYLFPYRGFVEKGSVFEDYTHIFVPYCTGDLHWGNNAIQYTKDLKIYHYGGVNANSAMEFLYNRFPAPPKSIFVTGCSAGAYGSMVWAAKIMKHYEAISSNTAVVQFGDSGMGVIAGNLGLTLLYNVTKYFPFEILPHNNLNNTNNYTYDINAVATGDFGSLTMPMLYEFAALRYPDQKFSQFSTAYDWNQAFFLKAMISGGAATLQDKYIWNSQMQMLYSPNSTLSNVNNYYEFLAEGDYHCVIWTNRYWDTYGYDKKTNNLQNKIYLNKWIENLLLSTTSPSNSVGCIKEACKIELDVLSIEEKESLPSNFFD